MRNMGERWGLGKSANRELSAMIERVAVECGDQLDLWPKRLVHQLVLGGLDDRAAAAPLSGNLAHDNVLYHVQLQAPLDALERLDLEWERAVRELHRSGWRQ